MIPDCDPGHNAANALRVLELAGRTDIPAAAVLATLPTVEREP